MGILELLLIILIVVLVIALIYRNMGGNGTPLPGDPLRMVMGVLLIIVLIVLILRLARYV